MPKIMINWVKKCIGAHEIYSKPSIYRIYKPFPSVLATLLKRKGTFVGTLFNYKMFRLRSFQPIRYALFFSLILEHFNQISPFRQINIYTDIQFYRSGKRFRPVMSLFHNYLHILTLGQPVKIIQVVLSCFTQSPLFYYDINAL